MSDLVFEAIECRLNQWALDEPGNKLTDDHIALVTEVKQLRAAVAALTEYPTDTAQVTHAMVGTEKVQLPLWLLGSSTVLRLFSWVPRAHNR